MIFFLEIIVYNNCVCGPILMFNSIYIHLTSLPVWLKKFQTVRFVNVTVPLHELFVVISEWRNIAKGMQHSFMFFGLRNYVFFCLQRFIAWQKHCDIKLHNSTDPKSTDTQTMLD